MASEIGTVYSLSNNKSETSRVTVSQILKNKVVEWVSEDGNYHCRYTYKSFGLNVTELQYNEWVDGGEIDEPFDEKVLRKLKKFWKII